MNYKPSGTLKRFVDVAKKPTRVLGSVERHVLAKPSDQSRRTDVLHPSEMVDPEWCHRSSYFQLQGQPVKSKRAMSFRLLSVFEEGHSIHAKWQKWFQEMGNLYGKWECLECGEFFWGDVYCHEGPLVYKEVQLFYEPLRIHGHADGWLVKLGDPMMLEIKSVGMGTIRWEAPELLSEHGNDFAKIWDAIKAPFMKHITQVQIYMKLAELIGMENYPEEAVIIYENKATQEAKEFVIPKSDFGIEHLFEAAQKIMNALAEGKAPACNIRIDNCAKCKEYSE